MPVLSTPPQDQGRIITSDRLERVDGGSTLAGKRHRAGSLDRLLRSTLLKTLGRIRFGRLVFEDGDERRDFGDHESSLVSRFEVLDPRFYRTALFGGGLGAAEAFRRGYWRSDDLVSLVRIFAKNPAALESLGNGWKRILLGARRAAHWLNRNTPRGSRRNIAAHYDLSNAFFSQFLDDTMTYSSGVFSSPESTLREASLEKYDRICRKLRLKPGDTVLEIGSGWGGFAAHAAKNYGSHVTATTISRKQYEYAQRRFAGEGLNDRVSLLLRDYRDLEGIYDKLVSIEMIEAVGHEFLPTYFQKCSELLRPDGEFLLQAITIPDQRYDQYRKSVDFIQRYIFPGGCLPSIGAITAAVGDTTDMRITHAEDFGEHYAWTLHNWRQRFFARRDEILALGMDECFLRTWDYYFSYCEGAFLERQIGVSQLLLQKPECRQASLLMPVHV